MQIETYRDTLFNKFVEAEENYFPGAFGFACRKVTNDTTLHVDGFKDNFVVFSSYSYTDSDMEKLLLTVNISGVQISAVLVALIGS
jgi:hypothetical protein